LVAGYMLGVIPLVSLTDHQSARRIYLASSALSTFSCFGVALCDDLLPAIGFRALAGAALAGMYMPGLRALTDGVEGARRARFAAWYTSSFIIGASLSFLLGRVGTLFGWRSAFILAGLLNTAGLIIAWSALPRADRALGREPRPVLDFRLVLWSRDALILIFGYAAVIWGSAGLRQWIVVFLSFCAADRAAVAAQGWSILVVGALIGFLGVPAGLLGNELSIRYGLRTIATVVFLLSALAGGLFGFTAMLPYTAVVSLSLVAGFTVQGNASNLTSGLLAVAPRRYSGATMALYSCLGFGGGFLGTVVFGVTLDQFGGTSRLTAWIVSFGTCGLACLAGSAATSLLSQDIWQPRP
jgi:predicted MFS family arabinose efflux permease